MTASKNVVDRYHKLNSRLAPSAGSSPRNGVIWLLTPPVAPAEARPRNADPNEVANLVRIGGEGSGFFVAANLIITNRHVVEDETYGMKVECSFDVTQQIRGILGMVVVKNPELALYYLIAVPDQ